MCDHAQRGAGLRIFKDDLAKGGSIQASLGVKDALTKARDDLIKGWLTRLNDGARDLIGVDHISAKLA